LVEHLLCKQGVIGSNPIVSRFQQGRGSALDLPRDGRPLGTFGCCFMGLVWDRLIFVPPRAWGEGRAVALLLFFGVVNQVLVRSWARRTTRVGVWVRFCRV
jgi:hypothetical protein